MFIMERVFKLAGKTHYSDVSFLVSSIISTGLLALVLQVLAFTGKLPYSGANLKTCFPREVMIAILLGSFSVPVLTNIIQDTVVK